MALLPPTPFVPDPGYEQDCRFHPRGVPFEPTPRGRVRPEAETFARRNTTGSVGLLFQTQLQNTCSKFRRPDPKNYSKENMRRIRQIQSQTKKVEQERREEKEQKTAIVKSSKYDHVQAKVTVHMCPHSTPPLPHTYTPPLRHTTTPSQSSRVHQSTQPSEKHSELRLELPNKEAEFKPVGRGPQRHHRSEAVGSEPDDSLHFRKSKNFLAANVEAAGRHRVKRPPTSQHLEQLKSRRQQELQQYKRGHVPQYLSERKEEWQRAEEERKAALPDPSVPPGHTLMPNKERLKTLQILREHEATLTAELTRLPLHSDSVKMKAHRGQLESKLGEIDDALKIFSRQKVFIKMDQ